MSKITPIRPGTEPPSGGDDLTEQPINVIEEHLAKARAICDLVGVVDREGLFEDTVGWALSSAMDHIDAAREAADKLHKEAQARREKKAVSARAVIPARIRRRWDAQALEQLCERLLKLEAENEALRREAAIAEESAEFWRQNAQELAGEPAGLTIEGRLVRLQEARS
jgi:hypothetical protein